MIELLAGYWPYLLHLLILVMIYIILSMSLNLIVGYTGLLNLGPVAFFAIGAYTSTLLVMYAGMPFIIGLIAGAVLAGLAGVLIGIPSLRLHGDYFAIATLGFAEIVRSILVNWTEVTRGPLGIPGIPRPELFGLSFESGESFLVLSFVLVIITYFVLKRLCDSGFGRVLKAIREDEIAALSIGKNVNKYKLISMGVGSFFAGIAGVLFAHYFTFIDPSSFVLNETVLMICMVVLGGMASLEGSILGAIILVLLPEPLRMIGSSTNIEILKTGFAQIRVIIYALVLIILMIKRPSGLMGRTEIFSKGRRK